MTKLTADSKLYLKLQPFYGISKAFVGAIDFLEPHRGSRLGPRIRWMPILADRWKRLTFYQFLKYVLKDKS